MAGRGRPPKNKTKEVKEVKKNNKVKETNKAKETGKVKEIELPEKSIINNIAMPQTKVKRGKRDLNEMIRVVNITNSGLSYQSKSQTGYRVDWDSYGEENFMEYKELINMRGAQRRFFEDLWIICEFDVLVDLGVDKYYKNIIDLDNIDLLFNKSIDDLGKTLKVMPKGIRDLIVDRAFEMRKSKKLDSLSVIEVIEKTLDVDLSI